MVLLVRLCRGARRSSCRAAPSCCGWTLARNRFDLCRAAYYAPRQPMHRRVGPGTCGRPGFLGMLARRPSARDPLQQLCSLLHHVDNARPPYGGPAALVASAVNGASGHPQPCGFVRRDSRPRERIVRRQRAGDDSAGDSVEHPVDFLAASFRIDEGVLAAGFGLRAAHDDLPSRCLLSRATWRSWSLACSLEVLRRSDLDAQGSQRRRSRATPLRVSDRTQKGRNTGSLDRPPGTGDQPWRDSSRGVLEAAWDDAGRRRPRHWGCRPCALNELVRVKRGVTADTALRLAQFFKTTPQFWMHMQRPTQT
jgi:hypothetical protein